MSIKKIPLSVTETYVADWAIWEMFREFAQNALDSNGTVLFFEEESKIIITNTGKLLTHNLLYGGGDKANDDSKRGKHGEGLKNAMLVAVRQGLTLQITSGNEVWTPSIEHSDLFGASCLHVTVTEYPINLPNVTIVIEGIPAEAMVKCKENYLPSTHALKASFGDINDGYGFVPTETPKLFIGGLFVCDMPKSWWEDAEYRYSYNLPPKAIHLDRDRNTVDEYKLQEIIATLLIKNAEIELLADLAYDNALDIRGYCEHEASDYYSSSGSESTTVKDSLSVKALALFYEKHGDTAFPIISGSRHYTLRCELLCERGFTPIGIKQSLYSMFDKKCIRGYGSDVIPKFDSIEFLTEVLKHKTYALRGKARKEITDQLAMLKRYKVD